MTNTAGQTLRGKCAHNIPIQAVPSQLATTRLGWRNKNDYFSVVCRDCAQFVSRYVYVFGDVPFVACVNLIGTCIRGKGVERLIRARQGVIYVTSSRKASHWFFHKASCCDVNRLQTA